MGLDVVHWDRYIGLLYRHGIRLNSNADTLIWDYAQDGCLTAKTLYDHLMTEIYIPAEHWWQKRLWTWRISPKIKCFWWLVLHHSILTWDNLVKRDYTGRGICVLCYDNVENIDHIFVFCRFTKYIWSLLEHIFSFAQDWGDLPLSENFAEWAHKQPRRTHFPILVSWILWKTRNSAIFE